MRHLLIPIFFGLALAGCAAKEGVRLLDSAQSVPNENAVVVPEPGGPAIVNIVERRFSNAIQQDVFLFTSASVPGQNILRVQLFGPVGFELDGQKSLGYSSVRTTEIARELRQEFPGVRMVTSPLFLQNNYGPFGYAFGRSSHDDACLYGWQQIRSGEAERTVFQNRGTIQIRVRLCDADATEEQLLAVMYGYTVRATFPAAGWNPFGDAPSVDPKLGKAGNPIYPRLDSLADKPQAVPSRPAAMEARPVQRRVEAVAPVRRKQTVTVEDVPPAETIPLPGNADMGSVVVPSPSCISQTEGAGPC